MLRCAGTIEEYSAHFDVPEVPTRIMVTATWTPGTPLAQTMRVYLVNDEGLVANATGPSPLTMDLDVASLKSGKLCIVATPAMPGVIVDQTIAYVLTLHYD